MSTYLHRSHNVLVVLYHLVFPAKYRRAIFDADVDAVLRDVCLAISERYKMKLLEIGSGLQRENARLQQELAFLKRAAAYFARESR